MVKVFIEKQQNFFHPRALVLVTIDSDAIHYKLASEEDVDTPG
jgi:hypothetical protein